MPIVKVRLRLILLAGLVASGCVAQAPLPGPSGLVIGRSGPPATVPPASARASADGSSDGPPTAAPPSATPDVGPTPLPDRQPSPRSLATFTVVCEDWGAELPTPSIDCADAVALALAAIGLYGLLEFDVSRRTTEIGVRSALGATRRNLLWLVMSDALRLVGAGLLVGLPAVWASTRLVSGMLFGLSPTDSLTIGGAAGTLVVTALVAAYLPAFRAARVNPVVALRAE
jgi:hypothetical protein